jgi:4-hydroxy-4-methyl-2-oxoglutarate aldolase
MQPSQQLQLIDRLAAIPYTGAISDILDEMGHPHQVLPAGIQSIQPGQTLTGRALTVHGEPAAGRARDEYFLPFLKMLGAIGPGDVVVSQPNDGSIAHFGELSCETAKFRGGRGAVIDGGIRDIDYILKLGFPVFVRYQTPQDIVGRWRVVDYNVPVTIGEVQIHPGDFVVGDRDGVVIIPQSIAEEAIAKAEAVVHTENAVRKAILDGVHPVTAYEKFGRF